MPPPRHYYRVVALQHPAFISLNGVWMEQRGLAPPVVSVDDPSPAPAMLQRLKEYHGHPVATVAEDTRYGRAWFYQRLALMEIRVYIPPGLREGAQVLLGLLPPTSWRRYGSSRHCHWASAAEEQLGKNTSSAHRGEGLLR